MRLRLGGKGLLWTLGVSGSWISDEGCDEYEVSASGRLMRAPSKCQSFESKVAPLLLVDPQLVLRVLHSRNKPKALFWAFCEKKESVGRKTLRYFAFCWNFANCWQNFGRRRNQEAEAPKHRRGRSACALRRRGSCFYLSATHLATLFAILRVVKHISIK